MNTSRKSVVVKQCDRCDNTYMVVGDAAVRLAQHRPAQMGPNGSVLHGVCPDHKRTTE